MRRWILAPALLVAACGFVHPLSAQSDAQPLTVEEVAQILGYGEGDVEKLRAGEIIAKDLERVREDQLTASVAMAIDAPLSAIAQGVKEGRYQRLGSSLLSFGDLSVPVNQAEWQEVGFTADEGGEVEELAKAEPGSDFNLSSEEFALLNERLGGERDVEAASAAYRDILIGRLNAYLEKGLAGVASYDRGGGDTSSPADEIRAREQEAEKNLGPRYPEFIAAVTQFPDGQSPDIVNLFFWKKVAVEDRPTFILTHQTIDEGESYLLVSNRQFFVGQTYNSLQAFTLAVEEEGRTYVFQANATATDQITGFFSGIAQSVGQPRIRESLTRFFDEARAQTP